MKYGKAGKSVSKMMTDRRQKVIAVALALIFIVIMWALSIPTFMKRGLSFTIVCVIILWFVVSNLEKIGNHFAKRAKHADKGTRAEERVGKKLTEIQGYTSFHDIVYDGFNIDHLLIGPVGIFVIETKGHEGPVSNEGDVLLLKGKPTQKNFLNQTWSQIYHIRDILKKQTGKEWPVSPVLCFSNAYVEVREKVKGVSVVNAGYLDKFIARQKTVLSQDDISRITSLIGGSITEIQFQNIPD